MWLLAASVLLGALRAGECPPHPPSCLLSPARVVLTPPAAQQRSPRVAFRAVPARRPRRCLRRGSRGAREGLSCPPSRGEGGWVGCWRWRAGARPGAGGAGRSGRRPSCYCSRRLARGLAVLLPGAPGCSCGQPARVGLRVRSGRSPSFGKERGCTLKHTHTQHTLSSSPRRRSPHRPRGRRWAAPRRSCGGEERQLAQSFAPHLPVH